MKIKIGIFGSAVNESPRATQIAKSLGMELGKIGDSIILINGACAGVPYEVANTARSVSPIEIWGFSPELSKEDHQKVYPNIDVSMYAKLIYMPESFELARDEMARKKYRNIMSTAHCDGGIIVSGRWGTMNEFTNLYDMEKVIGVLTGTGGVADGLRELHTKIQKPNKAVVFFENSPGVLVERMLTEVKGRKP
ncbi:MAG TPA: hypothetical protein VMR81_04190 [Patescibacteria group bacterium]|nr:hypothetical protein [Patescibacteria group bacterium]